MVKLNNMKNFKIILFLFIIPFISSCFKDKDSVVTGYVMGTFCKSTNENEIYVLSDTTKGANGSEFKYVFENEDIFKNINDKSRIYFNFKLIKEQSTFNYLVECLSFDTIPKREIIDVKEDEDDIRQSFQKNPSTLTNLSLSHDFLNIGTKINYKDKYKHQFYVLNDEIEQNKDIKNEITLTLYHNDEEKEISYYKDSLFYISVPVKKLQSLLPQCDTIYIKVVSKLDNMTGKSLRIIYENKQTLNN